jgi:nucleoside-diphosphate-sugar epimerase
MKVTVFGAQGLLGSEVVHTRSKQGVEVYCPTSYGLNLSENVASSSHSDLWINCAALSTCIYPDQEYIMHPLTEDQLHLGPPHQSNFGYAFSKRVVDVATRAYRQQHKRDFVTVIPNNLYGPRDNYDICNPISY